jgi:hypothetical protein
MFVSSEKEHNCLIIGRTSHNLIQLFEHIRNNQLAIILVLENSFSY